MFHIQFLKHYTLPVSKTYFACFLCGTSSKAAEVVLLHFLVTSALHSKVTNQKEVPATKFQYRNWLIIYVSVVQNVSAANYEDWQADTTY
jgi:hypothetical protein